MENKAVERIRQMSTPKVTIESCVDTPEGIKADIKYEYLLCAEKGAGPTLFAKVFTVLANKEGAIYFAPGLFH